MFFPCLCEAPLEAAPMCQPCKCGLHGICTLGGKVPLVTQAEATILPHFIYLSISIPKTYRSILNHVSILKACSRCGAPERLDSTLVLRVGQIVIECIAADAREKNRGATTYCALGDLDCLCKTVRSHVHLDAWHVWVQAFNLTPLMCPARPTPQTRL